MTDMRALRDAFEELERRADAFAPSTDRVTPSRRPRWVPVTVAAGVVAGLVAGAALLTSGPEDKTVGVAAGESTTPSGGVSTTTIPPQPTHPPSSSPTSAEELAERFKAVLDGTATFTVTDSGSGAVVAKAPPAPPSLPSRVESQPAMPESHTVGASIMGQLTAGGVTGGYDLVVYPDQPGREPWCDGGPGPTCQQRTLPDGSKLAAQRFTLQSGTGITHQVMRVTPEGLVTILHVSNESSPKGNGISTAEKPPLTLERMVEIITSDRW